MKKLLIAAIIGTLSSTMVLGTTDAFAKTTKTSKKASSKKSSKVAKGDPALEGAEKWLCSESKSFELKGDMKRDQVVTLRWGTKNFSLPRQTTTTGADRFHDAASGMDLVVIPTKAMLFSDKDSSRLADECTTTAMRHGAPAATQSDSLIHVNP